MNRDEATADEEISATASANLGDKRDARATVRLVVMDALMSKTGVHPAQAVDATAAIMRAMQDHPTRWAFRVHAGGTRT